MKYMIRPAVPHDCARIALHALPEDAREAEARGLVTAGVALLSSFNNSISVYSVVVEDEAVMMFGAIERESASPTNGAAVVWLVCADDWRKAKRFWLRELKRYVALGLRRYEVIYNRVLAEKTDTIRWLRWAGFDISPVERDAQGVEFHTFTKWSN